MKTKKIIKGIEATIEERTGIITIKDKDTPSDYVTMAIKKCDICGKTFVTHCITDDAVCFKCKNIIDKALDEISDFYIDTIRITGGEPSLVPEAIEYLIDGIIKRKIKVYNIHMMTNATIQSQKIKDSIIKYLKYSKDIKEERKKIFDYFSQDKTTMYASTKDKDLAWVMHLSTWEHDNLSTFNDVKKFYDIKHDNYILVHEKFSLKMQVLIECSVCVRLWTKHFTYFFWWFLGFALSLSPF